MNKMLFQQIQQGSRKTEITRIALFCHVFLSVFLIIGIWKTGGTINAEIVGWTLGIPFAMQGGMAAANAAEHKAKSREVKNDTGNNIN